MDRFMKGAFASLIIWCSCVPRITAQGNSKEAPLSQEAMIRELIRDLGATSFSVRQNAEKKLRTMENALPQLETAKHSGDPHVAEAAKRIGTSIREAIIQRREKFISDCSQSGEVDTLIAYAQAHQDMLTKTLQWQPVLDIGGSVMKQAIAQQNRPQFPLKESQLLKWTLKEVPMRKEIRVIEKPLPRDFLEGFTKCDSIESTLLGYGFIVCSGEVSCTTQPKLSGILLIANGTVRVKGEIVNSVIITDGSIVASRGASSSVLIARDTITIATEDVSRSFISSSSSIREFYRNTEISYGPGARLVENDPNPLGVIRWFHPRKIGMETSALREGMLIRHVYPKEFAARAGLQLDDLITLVEHTPFSSTEEFRRLLRRGYVQERCTLTVQRGQKTLDITLDFLAEEKRLEKSVPPK